MLNLRSNILDPCHKSLEYIYGRGLEFDMKCHILHDLRASTSFKETSPHHYKNVHKLKLMTNLTLFRPGQCAPPPPPTGFCLDVRKRFAVG